MQQTKPYNTEAREYAKQEDELTDAQRVVKQFNPEPMPNISEMSTVWGSS